MSKIKVLALDLDGTLTNDQKVVTPRTRAGFTKALQRHGFLQPGGALQ